LETSPIAESRKLRILKTSPFQVPLGVPCIWVCSVSQMSQALARVAALYQRLGPLPLVNRVPNEPFSFCFFQQNMSWLWIWKQLTWIEMQR
jgi:hypothetical protein